MSKLETNTIDTVSGTANLTIGSTNSSTVTFESGAATGHMSPAWSAKRGSAQTGVANSSAVTVVCDTEELDTDNAYSTSTGEFTVPSGKAGKYMVGASFRSNASGSATRLACFLTVGGTIIRQTNFNQNSSGEGSSTIHAVLDLSAGNVVAFKMFQDSGSSVNLEADGKTYFYGYRIGA
jgi:hypothetical protein